MIKFFRKIRQNLVVESRFSKYFIYAVGEIILVVIGILIAITLNNSNQAQSQRSISAEKLTKLRQLIYQDSINMAKTIDHSKIQIANIQEAIDKFDQGFSQLDYQSIMKIIIGSGPRTTPLDRSIYEEMLNSGEFSYIQDAELKRKIAAYYMQYEHFWWIIKNYIENSELPALKSILYQEDIIRKRHIEEIVQDQNLENGYLHFKNSINNSKNYGRFENYAFASRQLHEMIILYHEILRQDYMDGITINPSIKKD